MCNGSKTCRVCGLEKPIECYYWNYSTGGKVGPDAKRHRYRRAECSDCFRSVRKGKALAYKKVGCPERPPHGTSCDCCKLVPNERLFRDHTHTENPEESIMLGWVCRTCNGTILAGDGSLLQNAIDYKQRRGEHLRVAHEERLARLEVGGPTLAAPPPLADAVLEG